MVYTHLDLVGVLPRSFGSVREIVFQVAATHQIIGETDRLNQIIGFSATRGTPVD